MEFSSSELMAGVKHVCHDYALLQAGAWEMLNPHGPPLNHLIGVATLTQVRTLAEFFAAGTGPSLSKPDLKADYYTKTPGWNRSAFARGTPFMTAIDKCVAHMSLGRALDTQFGVRETWDGFKHLHGTVLLFTTTWSKFMESLDQVDREAFERELQTKLQDLKCPETWLALFQDQFDERVRHNANFSMGRLPGTQ